MNIITAKEAGKYICLVQVRNGEEIYLGEVELLDNSSPIEDYMKWKNRQSTLLSITDTIGFQWINHNMIKQIVILPEVFKEEEEAFIAKFGGEGIYRDPVFELPVRTIDWRSFISNCFRFNEIYIMEKLAREMINDVISTYYTETKEE